MYSAPIEQIIGDGKGRSALKDVEKVGIYGFLHEAVVILSYVDLNWLCSLS
jgi:hypothetical protein